MARIFIGDGDNGQGLGMTSAMAMALYFVLAVTIGLFPFIESLYRFDQDLSGKQSVLEQMWPIVSWKKIAAKLVTVVCNTILGIGLGIFSIVAYILLASNFERSIVDGILRAINVIFQSPTQLILGTLYILFCFLTMYLIAFFCIAFSKSISHKSKIAVPVGIATFVLIITALALLDPIIQRIPLVKFTIFGTADSLSSIILSVLVFFAALFGTSWLMENKVEH